MGNIIYVFTEVDNLENTNSPSPSVLQSSIGQICHCPRSFFAWPSKPQTNSLFGSNEHFMKPSDSLPMLLINSNDDSSTNKNKKSKNKNDKR